MKIGNFDLNKDGVYIIAELSANHNGSLQTALDTIKAAKDIGANAIKLQTYRADTITLNSKNEDFLMVVEHFGMEKIFMNFTKRHILHGSGTKSYLIMLEV